MAPSDSTLPKNPITAAVVVIFIHWSGATFADVSEATIWLGAVQIERGWMIGVFIHVWFVISFLLYWQDRGARTLRDLQERHSELEHVELFRNMNVPRYFQLLREACANSESAGDNGDLSSADLMDKLERGKLQIRQKDGVHTFVPRVERYRMLRYFVDFSQPGHVTGTSRPGPDDVPEPESMPRYPISLSYSGMFSKYEVWAFWRLVTRRIEWHREFLPWVLGWVAVVSFAAGAAGII